MGKKIKLLILKHLTIMETKSYSINHEEGIVSRTIVSKGQEFTATAKVDTQESFNVKIGEAIVDLRLEIMQRKRDLANTYGVIDELKKIIANEDVTKTQSRRSKHWMQFLQQTCEERDSQLENIRFAKKQLKKLTGGDIYEKMLVMEYLYIFDETDSHEFINANIKRLQDKLSKYENQTNN